MTTSIWRWAHLTLALFSSIFLIVVSLTGAVLAYDAIQEKWQPYKVEGFEQIKLSETIPFLREKYPELISLSVDHNQFVQLEGFDEEGNDFKKYIHPLTGKFLGDISPKSEFIQWNLSLHRSLFLHETGRFIVGIVSFLLFLIAVSGTVLIVKRQKGWKHFFAKIPREIPMQFYHVVSGKWLLLPIVILSLTGTYLFLLRFEIITTSPIAEKVDFQNSYQGEKVATKDFEIFQKTLLKDVRKMEFPMFDDADELYKIELKDATIWVNPLSGKVEQQQVHPFSKLAQEFSLELHTGRINSIWAFIFGLAALNILGFIYSGFVITLKRKKTTIKNRFTLQESTHIILYGSENGSTLFFANQVHKQLLSNGVKSHLTELNQYQKFEKATHLLVFTSTYGQGDAPSNANLFLKKAANIEQTQEVKVTIVGFGSKSYKSFCGFAYDIQKYFDKQSWVINKPEVFTINEKSTSEFLVWINEWNKDNNEKFQAVESVYKDSRNKLQKMKVLSTREKDVEQNFMVTLKTNKKFTSGDLLAIYPMQNEVERLYSIGRKGNEIQLVVKLHPFGKGSQYLYQLKKGDTIEAKIIENTKFHFSNKDTQVVMIANGTGIAPFLGMIEENTKNIPVHLFCGFRTKSDVVLEFEKSLHKYQEENKLISFEWAFSREENQRYVMQVLSEKEQFLSNHFAKGGKIMICGSLSMQKDVEALLESICKKSIGCDLIEYKEKGLLVTDCY